MILDFLNPWRTECPAAARDLGLLHEHRAIARRHERMRRAWASHLQASREAILAAAARCPQRRSALIIGAGDCLDVPVAELAGQFEQLVLADIVIGPVARGWARKLAPKVRCEAWDASGALAALAARPAALSPAEAVAIFASADAGPPPGGEADLVVSANCISQLGLVPGHSLPAKEQDGGLPDRCAQTAARRHLNWLAARSGVRVLLADMARLNLSPDGKVIKREDLSERYGLAQPDRQWRWNLAPIPEWAPDFHRVHEVGAWIYAG